MIKFSAEMYIDKIGERGPYDQKIMLRADLHDEDSKYPQHIEAVVKAKKFDIIPEDLIPGDRVMIDFYPVSKSGVSKSTGKPWTITELIVMKFVVTEKLPRTNTKPDVDEVVPDDDLPF